MGRPGPRQSDAPAAFLGSALQPASFSIEDLEEERGDAVVLKVDHEGTPRTADSRDLAPAASHEDLAGGDRFDLYSGRRSAAIGVLQPELERPPRRHHVREEPWEADPGAWRHRRPQHQLARGVCGVGSGGDGMRRCGAVTPDAVWATLLVAPSS